MLILGTLLITGAAAAAAPGSEGVYGFFYVWVVFAAFLFFPRRSATLQALFAALAYAAVLAAEDAPVRRDAGAERGRHPRRHRRDRRAR